MTLNCLQRRFKLDPDIKECVQYHNHIVTSMWSKSSNFLLSIDHPYYSYWMSLLLPFVMLHLSNVYVSNNLNLDFLISMFWFCHPNGLFHNIHPPYQVEKFHGNYIVNCPHQLWAHSQTPTRSILNTNSFSTSLQPLKVPDYGMQFCTSCFVQLPECKRIFDKDMSIKDS